MKRLIVLVLLLACGYVVYNAMHTELPETVVLGERAPSFALQTMTNTKLSNLTIPKEGVVLNFWASYCPPCVKEMPLLQQQDVPVWGVNAGESVGIVQHFVSKQGITFPILLDRQQLAIASFEVMTLPTTYFIDGDGIVQKRVVGELTKDSLQQGLQSIQ